MTIQLSDHFTHRRLLRFTLPSIGMTVFTSIYSIVDGFFVSNFAGKTPFAAINFIMPVLMILSIIGFMFGTGGSALIAKLLGEGKKEKANETFSLIVYTTFALGVLFAALGMLFIRPIAALLGATGELLDSCVLYARIILLALPFYVLQNEFQCLFVTAEKPSLGLTVTVASGVTNIILDALFIAVFGWGLVGAAVATSISQTVGGMLPLLYFFRRNDSLLRLRRCRLDLRALAFTCANGSSELMNNISISLVSMLYNAQLLRYAGENGLAAYGVLMYVSMIFQSVFVGYSVGSAPVISYHYGAQHVDELQSLLRKSIVIVGCFAAAMCCAGIALSTPLSSLYVSYDKELLEMTIHAFCVFSVSFLFSGYAIFSSSFFTALSDGVTSALISILRTFLFQITAIILFPILWGIDGIWWSIVAADLSSVLVSLVFLFGKRKKYQYF